MSETKPLTQQMRKAVTNCMKSYDAGECVETWRVEDWADQLEEIAATHLAPMTPLSDFERGINAEREHIRNLLVGKGEK